MFFFFGGSIRLFPSEDTNKRAKINKIILIRESFHRFIMYALRSVSTIGQNFGDNR